MVIEGREIGLGKHREKGLRKKRRKGTIPIPVPIPPFRRILLVVETRNRGAVDDDDDEEQSVNIIIDASIIKCLLERFVPLELGFSRECALWN